jgi:hypothetical protein
MKCRMNVDGRGWLKGVWNINQEGITMVNDRMMMRVAMLFALAVLPSLASSQVTQSAQSVQSKVPDWKGKEVTQITIEGSYQQLKAFKDELPAPIIKALGEQTIVHSAINKKKLVYSYQTGTGDSTVAGFYSALRSSTEKMTGAHKPPVMRTSIIVLFPCRLRSCGGQLSWVGPSPPCDC